LGDASTTLTVTGDYAGGGSLVISGALSGIDGLHGILSVDGDTSGATTVAYANPSGASATCDDILLVKVGGTSSGTFALSGGGNARVNAGSCQYQVARGAGALSNNWYLVNAPIAITTATPVPTLNETALALLALLLAGGAAARARRGWRSGC